MTLKSRFHILLVIVLTLLVVSCSGNERETTVNQTGDSDHTLIQLRDPLDEPEYYCVDVPGFGPSLDLEGTLTAHTCKPNADDELFMVNHPARGQIYMPAYDRCMEALGRS